MLIGFLIVSVFYIIWGFLRGMSKSLRDFIVAEGTLSSSLIFATMVATWCSGFTIFSPGEFAFSNGVQGLIWHTYLNTGLWAAIPIVLAIRRVFPEGMTLAQWIGERYNAWARVISAFCVIAFGIVENSFLVWIGAKIINIFTGMEFVWAAVLFTAIYALYTVFGGLRAVTRTDLMQMLTFVWLAIVVIPAAIYGAGGPLIIYKNLEAQGREFLNVVRVSPFIMLAWFLSHTATVGYGPIWQRTFATKHLLQFDRVMCSWYFAWAPFAISGGVLGVIGRAMIPAQVPTPSDAVPMVVSAYTHPIIQFIFMIALNAIFLATADSNCNVAASCAVVDIAGVIKPKMKEKSLLITAYVTSAIIALLCLPIGVYLVTNALTWLNYIWCCMASVAVIIALGLFWKRGTGWGGVAGLLVGIFLTVYGIIAGWPDLWPPFGWVILFSVAMFMTGFVCVIVSYITPEKIARTKPPKAAIDLPGSWKVTAGPLYGAIAIFLCAYGIFPFVVRMFTSTLVMPLEVFSLIIHLPIFGGFVLLGLLAYYWWLDARLERAFPSRPGGKEV
jgi:Na+/proline symporter